MAVIDVSMIDIPNSCAECTKRYICNLAQDNGWIDNERDVDCPLKSVDEMIEEIEETYINNCDFNYQIAIDIIHKYCYKENEDG